MKIRFLGTGTSMGVPVAGNLWTDYLGESDKNNRNRCSVWVYDEHTSIVIDAGPEFRLQTIAANIQHLDALLLTHHHYDHIGGIEDLRAYCYNQRKAIPVYCNAFTKKEVTQRCHYLFGENKYKGSADLDLIELEAGDSFQVGNIPIQAIDVNHGDIQILGYRIGKFAYLTDLKKISDEAFEMLLGVEYCAMSGLQWNVHPTHQSIPEAIVMAEKLQLKKAYLIHMNASLDHDKTQAQLPDNVQLAYDNLEIEI